VNGYEYVNGWRKSGPCAKNGIERKRDRIEWG